MSTHAVPVGHLLRSVVLNFHSPGGERCSLVRRAREDLLAGRDRVPDETRAAAFSTFTHAVFLVVLLVFEMITKN